jgi:hypothetical protein
MKYITSITRSDGFGAQFQNVLYDILYAQANGYEYLYTPIQNIEHNYNNDEGFIDYIESIMNIKNNYNNDTCCKNNIDCEHVVDAGITYKFIESDIDKYVNYDSMNRIREVFWQNKDKNFFNNDKINVAVHIRRPNSHDNRTQGTDTPNHYYKIVMDIIRERYDKTKLLFHIYSQGGYENFKSFENNDTVFHLNENLRDTFTGMVASDILITSRSSFSYVAALLNENHVYYLSFWHPPLNDWFKFTTD